jgi:hypothetical protein
VSTNSYQYGLIATVWGSRIVPLLVLGIVAYSRREQLRAPIAFWVFSVLSFHGIAWFVGQFAQLRLMFFANRFDTPTYDDKISFLVFLPTLLQFSIAAVISILPIVWLHRLLATETNGQPDT